MALETIRQQIAVNNVASPVGVEVVAEKRGAYRGETVRSAGENSKIAQAGRTMNVRTALNTDAASLMRRSLRQGQGAHLQATARIADYYDKLPQMPNTEALTNLVEFMAQLGEQLPELLSHSSTTLHEALVEKAEAGAPKEADDTPEPDNEEIGGEGGGAQSQRQSRDDKIEADVLGDIEQLQNASGGLPPQMRESAEKVFAALQRFDGDATHQFAALDILREHFANSGASESLQGLLDSVALTFEQGELGRDVRAGMAIAKIADQSAQTLQTDPGAVRQTYRQMLREQRNIGQLFDALAKYDLSKKFEAVVDVFRSAAGQDMASTGPSTDRAFLGHLMTELGNLKKLQTTFEASRELIVKTERLLPPRERGLATPTEVTSRVLNFAARSSVGVSDARGLLGRMETAGPEGQVAFANGLRALHSDLPDEIVPSPQARLQQGAALMSLLNTLVAAEEQHHASRVAAG